MLKGTRCWSIYRRRGKKLRVSRAIRGRPDAAWVVVLDPDPIAGFSIGAQISWREHIEMLLMCTYTPGTVVEDVYGTRWLVYDTVDEFDQSIQKVRMIGKESESCPNQNG